MTASAKPAPYAQLAPPARQPKSQVTHQSLRSQPGQPVEAPHNCDFTRLSLGAERDTADACVASGYLRRTESTARLFGDPCCLRKRKQIEI